MSNRTIIVGSGVAAVAVARTILRQNESAEVVMLEAGGNLPMADYRKWLDFVMTGTSPTRAFADGKKDADINNDGGFGLRGGRLIARGGSTNHWGGWCPRMKPEDFHLGDARKNSINWPITYDDLAPFYTQAESFLHVCGDSTSNNPPRFGGRYPYDPVPFTALDHILIPTLKNLGFGYEALPIARNPNQCRTTGTCRYCPFDARYAAGTDLTRLLSEYPGRISLEINSPVISVKMKDKKTAEGVLYIDGKIREEQFLPGDRVIVAAGTIESAKVLLASSNHHWSNGVGNDTGHLGQHLVTHPLLRGVARMPSNNSLLEQEIDFPTLICRHYDSEKTQTEGKMLFVRDGKYIVPNVAKELSKKKSPDNIKGGIINNTRIELRALIEAFPAEGNKVEIAPGRTSTGLPRTKIHYFESKDTVKARMVNLKRLQDILCQAGLKSSPDINYSGARSDHSTGTCRMSSNPTEGVVDSSLKVHETDNVYVCSNAVFPNSGAANPTVTLVSLAFRLGEHLETS